MNDISKNFCMLILVAAVVLAAPAAHAQAVCASADSNRFAAVMTGNAAGHAAFVADRESGLLSYRVHASGLSGANSAHLQRGSANVIDLTANGQTFVDGVLEGSVSASASLLDEIYANPSAFSVNVSGSSGSTRGALNGRGMTLMSGNLLMAGGGGSGAGRVKTDVASNAMGVYSLGFVDDDPSGNTVRVDFDLMTDSIEGFDTASVVLVSGDFSEDVIDLVSDAGFVDGRLHGTVRLSRDDLARILANPSGYHLQFRSPDDGMFSGPMGEAVTTFIPAFGRTGNAFGNQFNSDLRLYNPGSRPAIAFIQFFPAGATDALAGNTAVIRLEPNQSRAIEDAVQTLFGRNAGIGSLRIVSTAQVVADSEILDSARNARFGQFISGVGNCSTVTDGLLTSLAASQPASGFRTNVFVGNPGPRPAVAHFELRDEQGRLLDSTTLRLPAHAQSLMPLSGGNGLFRNAGGELRNAVLTMHADTPLFLASSLVQNGTGEARFTMARSID